MLSGLHLVSISISVSLSLSAPIFIVINVKCGKVTICRKENSSIIHIFLLAYCLRICNFNVCYMYASLIYFFFHFHLLFYVKTVGCIS